MRIANVIKKQCVACGCCVKACPKKTISIYRGVYAAVNKTFCIGCGKCKAVCPASVIELREGNE